MADEQFPLGLEAIVVASESGHFRPGLEEVDWLRYVRIPDRARRVDPRLAPAILQARNRRAERAVDMERHEIVAADPRAPRAVDMRDHAADELEGGVGGIVRVGRIRLSVLIDAFWNVRRAKARDAFHLAEQIVEHI